MLKVIDEAASPFRNPFAKKVAKLVVAVLRPARSKRPRKSPLRLATTVGFGRNPGRLVMKSFVTAKLPNSPRLVVVLHGCG